MRADRLVSLVLLLRRHGRMSATEIAHELEVSTRTVLRDMEALSTAGVPVYAERGRHGGFALLPGFRTELTGLNTDEALALLVAGSRRGGEAFGLGSALAAAMRKVVDALPESARGAADDASRRLLVDPEIDLLARPLGDDDVPSAVATVVRRAVLVGLKLRIRYEAIGQEPEWRTIDPIGLVTARGQAYLLATRSGEERTYRMSRVLDAELLTEPAERPDGVDLEQAWRTRSTRFRSGGDRVDVSLRVRSTRLGEVIGTALSADVEESDDGGDTASGGWTRLRAGFHDARHAEWALWQLGTDGEALAPSSLRAALRERAIALAEHYRASP